MGVATSIADFLGGSVFKEAKDLITEYWPPDVSPEKRAEFDAKFQELQNQKQNEAAQIAAQTLSTELADTQNARATHQLSNMPAVITMMLTAMVCGLLYTITQVDLTPGNREIAIGLFGIVFANWGACIQFWVGTTRSSAEKSQIIAQSSPVR